MDIGQIYTCVWHQGNGKQGSGAQVLSLVLITIILIMVGAMKKIEPGLIQYALVCMCIHSMHTDNIKGTANGKVKNTKEKQTHKY